MAKSCASLDHTWSHHLPTPAPSLSKHPHAAWFSPAAAAFEHYALASALVRASASPSPSSSPAPSTSTVSSSASELSYIPHDALAAPPSCTTSLPGCRAQTRPTGRVSKRKTRAASRRAQTTYVSADPADFRRMVQEITGLQVPGAKQAPAAAGASPAAPTTPSPLAFMLPTLDTSAFFLLDRPPSPSPPQRWEDKTSDGGAAAMATAAEPEARAGDSSLLLMRELEAMVSAPVVVPSAFPTLESWGMI